MTRDDIIRMAREAYGDWYPNAVPHELERFAALVAAAECKALKDERRRDMAEIYSLRESEESLREENERLREENERLRNTKHYEAPFGFVLNPDYLVPELKAEIKRLQDMLYEQLGELTALRADKQMRVRMEQQLKKQPR